MFIVYTSHYRSVAAIAVLCVLGLSDTFSGECAMRGGRRLRPVKLLHVFQCNVYEGLNDHISMNNGDIGKI